MVALLIVRFEVFTQRCLKDKLELVLVDVFVDEGDGMCFKLELQKAGATTRLSAKLHARLPRNLPSTTIFNSQATTNSKQMDS